MAKPAEGQPGIALFALGFRPFYLLGAIFSVLALPYWIASYIGPVPWGGYLRGISWHSHEMIFGYAAAVIAGFLLTAVRNWTGLPTPVGARLLMLSGLWLLARLTAVTGPAPVAVLLDTAFLPLLAVIVAIPIWRSRNSRNYKIPAILLALSLANIVYHLSYLGIFPVELMSPSLVAALDVITILLAIVGGRVIPAFTNNAIASARSRHIKSVEIAALGSLVLILIADSFSFWFVLTPPAWAILLTIAAVSNALRLFLWQPQKTLDKPLLLMLPVAYCWILISLALRAAAPWLGISATAATHARTIGAIGSMMMAMMTRSALGHTGRQLAAGWVEMSAFVFLQIAAILRVTAWFIPASFYREAIVLSGMFWSLAFAVFLLRYWVILTRPRIDGRPG